MPKRPNQHDNALGLLPPFIRLLSARFQRFYFRAIESVGHHKRDILVTRVESARDGLEEAKAQFQNALEKFSALTEFDGGSLELLKNAIKAAADPKTGKAPIELLVQNLDYFSTIKLDYHGGLKYPHLTRVASAPDRLDEIAAARK